MFEEYVWGVEIIDSVPRKDTKKSKHFYYLYQNASSCTTYPCLFVSYGFEDRDRNVSAATRSMQKFEE